MKAPGQDEVVHTFNAFRWSIKGLVSAWRTEISFRVDVILFVLFFAAGLWLGDGAVEKAVLVAPLFLVLALDLLNAAVETVVDMVSPDYSEAAGRAKDMASAGVFCAMVSVIVVWALILVPRYL